MFDDLIRRLKELEKPQSVPIQLHLDDDGYFDRRCPAPECGAAYKVLFEDWKAYVPDEIAWCPICGDDAEPSDYNTPEQSEEIRATALRHVQGQLDDAMRRARKGTEHHGFISMSWSHKPGAPVIVIPAEAAPAMTQLSTCEKCGCRYASVGAAFFCPVCGPNSARSTFAGALATIRASVDLAEKLPTMVADRDVAADTARQINENSLVRVWASFQRLAEATYNATPAGTAASAPRNAFQNLERSDRLWKGAIGKTYAEMLANDEHRDLVRLVQARHVLSHKDALVDADYVAKSGDPRYKVGQRLVVTGADVRRLADIAEKLAAAL